MPGQIQNPGIPAEHSGDDSAIAPLTRRESFRIGRGYQRDELQKLSVDMDAVNRRVDGILNSDETKAKLKVTGEEFTEEEKESKTRSLRYSLSESLLSEVLHRREIEKYIEKVKQDRDLRVGNVAEYELLSKMLINLEAYSQKQRQYTEELLSVFGYNNLQKLYSELFVAAGIEQNNNAIDPFTQLIQQMGPNRGKLLKLFADRLAAKSAIAGDTGVDAGIVEFFETAARYFLHQDDLAIEVFKDAIPYEKIEQYSRQNNMMSPGASIAQHTLLTSMNKMITNERGLMWRDISQKIDSRWQLSNGAKIAATTQTIRECTERAVLQFNETKRDSDLVVIHPPRDMKRPVLATPEQNESIELEDFDSMDFAAKVPFHEFAQAVLKKVDIFRELSEVIRKPEFLGWEATYIRQKEGENEFEDLNNVPTDFQPNDQVEVKHNNKSVFIISPTHIENTADNTTEAKGISVKVLRHSDEDIYMAIQITLEAAIRAGTSKEIFVSVDANLNDEKKKALAVRYVRAILSQNAIPVLTRQDGTCLTEEETEQFLRDCGRADLAEHYVAQRERTIAIQEQDELFIKEFLQFVATHPTLTNTEEEIEITMRDPNMPTRKLDMGDIVFRLVEIVLVYVNLTQDKFLDYLMSYVMVISGNKNYSEQEKAETKKALQKSLIKMMAEKDPPNPIDYIAAVLLKQAKDHFRPHAPTKQQYPTADTRPHSIAEDMDEQGLFASHSHHRRPAPAGQSCAEEARREGNAELPHLTPGIPVGH